MRVAVVGSGFSGTMAAVRVAALAPSAEVILIEKARFAAGAAYSTGERRHLLNVRAGNMSALATDPGHFERWAGAKGLGGPGDYLPRMEFGRYLGEMLEAAKLRRVTGEAVALEGSELVLGSGDRVAADVIVLAGGNYPGRMPPGLPAEIGIDNPWSGEGAAAVREAAAGGGEVLLVGTGLTMVDVALSLTEAGFRGRMTALSRRGLLPRAHLREAEPALVLEPPVRLAELVRAVRRGEPWRASVDSLRPHSVDLWRGFSEAEKRRFLRHLRPWWDVHRHRIAPDVAARIQELRAEGRLEILAGRIAGFASGAVTIARRGGGTVTRPVAVAINCTGPEGDITRVGDPLIRQLLASGAARPDPLRLGLEVDDESRVVGADGRPSPSLYAIGPLSRGAFWEIVAVPDIRRQVEAVARSIAY